jgi:hypothetical protein
MAQPPVRLMSYISRAQAEILRGLLEAEGITVVLSQEAAGSVLPVDVGAFGQVELLVPADQAARAREILGDVADQPSSSDDAG